MAKRLRGEYSKQTKGQNRATIKAQLKADMKSGKMKMTKNEVPFGGVSKAVLKYATRTGARIIADRKGAKIVAEKTARRKNPVTRDPKDDLRKDPGGTGGGNIYRAPGRSNKPRLRDTDDTPRKTTVRQKVGPKTKSGKFTEKKYAPKVSTQPPARTKPRPEAKPKFDPTAPIKPTPRNLPANMRLRKAEDAKRARRIERYKAERARQADLAEKRGGSIKTPGSTPNKTIEERIFLREESVPYTSRNQSEAIADRMPNAELRRYAQLLRDSNAKSPNVSPAQIAGGRARALMPTAERRNAILKAQRERIIKKAKAKGMTDAQISASIKRARAEAAAIARRAAK